MIKSFLRLNLPPDNCPRTFPLIVTFPQNKINKTLYFNSYWQFMRFMTKGKQDWSDCVEQFASGHPNCTDTVYIQEPA